MHFGFPATVAGSTLAAIPAAVFAVAPGGLIGMGVAPLPATFPFGVPFSVAGSTFIAVPAAALAVAPAVV